VSFLFLVAWGLIRSGRRVDVVVGVAVTVVCLLGLNWLFARMSPGYSLLEGWKMMRDVASKSQGGGAGLSYWFSGVHLRDFGNEHFLIGPLATYLFLPAVIYGAVRGSLRKAPALFLTLASAVYLAGSWALSEPLLGYARDWDLFAPAAVCYTAAGIYFVADNVRDEYPRRRLLVFAVVLSFIHIVPWVWITHSEERSVERFKTLPLGAGRTGVVLGNYFMRTKRQEQAVEWFQKALDENPVNSNAYAFLGVILTDHGRYEDAVASLGRAVSLRPDKEGFRAYYIDALIRARHCNEAADNLIWMSSRRPELTDYWHTMGDSLIAQGCAERLPEVYEAVVQYMEKRLLSEAPRPGDHMALGVMYGKMDRREDALRHFHGALALDPDNPAVLFNMGTTLRLMGRFEESRTYFESFIEVGGNHPYVSVARRYLEEEGAPSN